MAIDGRPIVRSRNLLYSDDVGRDACGIGGVAARGGLPSHEVIEKTLRGLKNVEHRGGVCGEVGDGAGLTCQLPQSFFQDVVRDQSWESARSLSSEHRLAVGVFFIFESDPGKWERAKTIVAEVLGEDYVRILGWREVPTNDEVLPELSLYLKPRMEHLIVQVHQVTGSVSEQVSPEDMPKVLGLEHWLYKCRLELRERFAQENIDVYVCSFSATRIAYKGLLTSEQFQTFYPDLMDPNFKAGLAIFHRRYSTNTYPNWKISQPFRYGCHNGEINTIHTNRHAVHAYSRSLDPPLPGIDLLSKGFSDSSNLDEWIEHLVLERRWSLLRALRLSVPPTWENEVEIWGQDAVDVLTYYRRALGSLGAWDGPAGVVATDGFVLAGLVDRMGLRPVRWYSDKRGWLYVASEVGVFGVDDSTIVASGQLQPGEMIAMDTLTDERLDSHQIMDRVVEEAHEELKEDVHELNRTQILIPESFGYSPRMYDSVGSVLEQRQWTIEHLLQAHGWDFDRAQFVKEMAKLRKEPLSSMGHDRVLTIFSQHHPTLFKYLQQTFAEVTNPPIDPYREGGAMSLTSYLGRSPWTAGQGHQKDLPCRQMELPMPVLNGAMIEEIRHNEVLGLKTFSSVFPIQGGVEALKESLHRLRSEAERAIHDGYKVLCLNDREAFIDGLAPIPSLLSLGSVHQYLCQQGLRNRCSLIIQAGDVQEGHDIACLIAFGADAVHPYLMLRLLREGLSFKDPETKQEWELSRRECLENAFAALEDSFKKIISKMGITTVDGYRGAMLFEAVGFGPEIMEFLGDFPSRIGGLGLKELVEDADWRLQQVEKMRVLGRNRDYHAFNARVRMALRKASVAGAPTSLPTVDNAQSPGPNLTHEEGGEAAYSSKPAKTSLRGPVVEEYSPEGAAKAYDDFTTLVNERVPTVLRDMFSVPSVSEPVDVSEVQAAKDLIQNHFRGAAMSHGALTRDSHETIAAALNELGGISNGGEGGEARYRNDLPEKWWGPFWERVVAEREENPDQLTLNGDIRKSRLRSRGRQLASGRFGVDAEYLVNGEELQIKMAQGAKPGEGGQLMGKKVTAEIAEIRYGKPGTDLISPPPHHDIYSIEDLAQLIYDLKAICPTTPVCVKLVAVENVGTIAVGVAKAGADIIEMDGVGGGTGAAMLSSKEHAGLPSEMGLAEAHQALVVNGLRHNVKLRVGGGIKNGLDVIKYALFGAEQFSFGQALMVSVGCIVCKSCHIPNCPTGITGTQGEYKGTPEHTKAYLKGVANEVREHLARLGAKHIDEIVGRTELLQRRTNLEGRSNLLDLSKFMVPDMALCRLDEKFPQTENERIMGVCLVEPNEKSLNARILEACEDAIESEHDADLMFRIRNGDRSVGATIAGKIARLYGREGMPGNKKIKVRFKGEAGQSFGAWCVNGLDLELRGFAQDGVAKGISGGNVVVTLDYDKSDYGGELQSVAGNNVGYGATGGCVFIGGRAGHRLAIRNSGCTIVAEAAGKYACEYMTRGRVLILGPTENEIGSGMTGGELFVYDPNNEVRSRIHSRSVVVLDCEYVDYEWMHQLIITYQKRTGSRQAEMILKNWGEVRRSRKIRKILPTAVAHKMEHFAAAGTSAG